MGHLEWRSPENYQGYRTPDDQIVVAYLPPLTPYALPRDVYGQRRGIEVIATGGY
jgi:hypothetical protein